MIGWLSDVEAPEVLAYWPDAPLEDPATLAAMLASARVQCEQFAPDLGGDALVPANYMHAQVLQARALYRAGMAGMDGRLGVEGQSLTLFPMDWAVKALLRPKRGVPGVR